MKKIAFWMFLLMICGSQVWGGIRSNLVLFTSSGDRFTVYVDGMMVNDFPVNNLKLTGVLPGRHDLRVEWITPNWSPFTAQLFINESTEVTYEIAWDSRRNYALNFISEYALDYNPAMPPAQTVIAYQGGPGTAPGGTVVNSGNPGTYGYPHNTNASVGIATDDGSVGVSISVNDPNGAGTNPPVVDDPVDPVIVEEEPVVVEPVLPDPLPGYMGPIGCEYPTNLDDFDGMKRQIGDAQFESTRMTLAKQILRDRCLLTSQVVAIAGMFTFENDKLEFSKWAYDRTYDIGNYYKLNDIFTFESSIRELDKYISER